MNDQQHRFSDFAASEYAKELAAVQKNREGKANDCFHPDGHDEKDCFHTTSHDEKDCFHPNGHNGEDGFPVVAVTPDVTAEEPAAPGFFKNLFLALRTLPHVFLYILLYIILFCFVVAGVWYAFASKDAPIPDSGINLTIWVFLIGLVLMEVVAYFIISKKLKKADEKSGKANQKVRGSAVLMAILKFVLVSVIVFFVLFCCVFILYEMF